jgi:hypothetical protein
MPADEIGCARCGRKFREEDFVACIAARIMGDECTDSYYWCGSCGTYTLLLQRDVFAGPEAAPNCALISREEGDRRLALIRSCTEPGDDRCRCEAHQAYFDGFLD